MDNYEKVVGVDISKDTFDVAFLEKGREIVYHKYGNKEAGFVNLLEDSPEGACFVMEASGPYYYLLAKYLFENKRKVCVVNPLVIKRFMQMSLGRTKTDKADAAGIARFGHVIKPKLWLPTSSIYLTINQLYGIMARLVRNRTSAINQLHAYNAVGKPHSKVKGFLEKEIEELNVKVKDLEGEIERHIQKEDSKLFKLLQGIPGIGPKSSMLLIVSCKGFKAFENYRQVISYLGLSPRIYESGTSVKGKAHICKMGMGKVRTTLYVAAMNARRYNKACKDLYERLRAKGKPFRVAMIAVVNKLIKQVFAIAKSGKEYVNGHQSQLLVAK